jgi:hypothetical protein
MRRVEISFDLGKTWSETRTVTTQCAVNHVRYLNLKMVMLRHRLDERVVEWDNL